MKMRKTTIPKEKNKKIIVKVYILKRKKN